jgi:uncharacterized protein (TIGR02001 family)
MRNRIIGVAACILATTAAPALAQDAAQDDLSISGSVAVTSDYRYRGISQNQENFALQGSVNVEHASGLYVGFWGSTVDFDTAVSDGPNQEIDLYAGYKTQLSDGVSLDAGLMYYWYPGGNGLTTDYFEPFAKLTGELGPVEATGTVAYAWKQNALSFDVGRDDTLYLRGDLAYALGDALPLTLKGGLGYSSGRSILTLGQKDYFDWSVGADASWENFTLNVSYIDTDLKRNVLGAAAFDQVDDAVVLTLTASF